MLAGGGKHENEINQKIIEYGFTEEVVLLGKVSDIDQLLLKSKIFVLSSYQEGYPNALCEAMSAGLACISFDIVAGPRDIIIDNENGFLIPDNDIQALTEKIQYLIDNVAIRERLGSNARKISETNSIELIGNTYLNFMLK
jgi:GalNAc-alpha-(1->4)-GalNAc-alpha-(1->3)-diNAcBac-PP-undecaprenol alpha-1,4-N-acetyl-D-galactosaminyltransferase